MEPTSFHYLVGNAVIELQGSTDYPFTPPLHAQITVLFTVHDEHIEPGIITSFIAGTLTPINIMFTSHNAAQWAEIVAWAIKQAIRDSKAPAGIIDIDAASSTFAGISPDDQHVLAALNIPSPAAMRNASGSDLFFKEDPDSFPRSMPDIEPPYAARGDSPPPPIAPQSAPAPAGAYSTSSFGQRERKKGEGLQQSDAVACSAYYPAEISSVHQEPLLVYISKDDPETIGNIAREVSSILGHRATRGNITNVSSPLTRGSELTIVPKLPGIICIPSSQSIIWHNPVHKAQFQMQGDHLLPGTVIDGNVMIFLGPLLFAEIPIRLTIQTTAPHEQDPTIATAKVNAYRRIFASYSHKDSEIVKHCRQVSVLTGDEYLQDVTNLRTGEHFDEKLKTLITEADIFQLFWSNNAAKSAFVAEEWQYALAIHPLQDNFIRPIFWEDPLPNPPSALRPIHFQIIRLADIGIRSNWLSRLFGNR